MRHLFRQAFFVFFIGYVLLTSPRQESQLFDIFSRPVKCTPAGVRSFFRHTFNHPVYAQEYLPACFAHMVDLFEYGKKNGESLLFFEQVLLTFLQKLKESYWIDPYALIVLLEKLPTAIPFRSAAHTSLREIIRTELYSRLRNDFNILQADPEKFLDLAADALTEKISAIENPLRPLQHIVVRFFEHSLSKIIWGLRYQEGIAPSLRLLAEHLESCWKQQLLPDFTSFNACLWSLLTRLNYLVDCAGSQIEDNIYTALEKTLLDPTSPFMRHPESEKLLPNKHDFIVALIQKGRTKRLASLAENVTASRHN